MQSNTIQRYSEFPLNECLPLVFLSALKHIIDFSITFIAPVKQFEFCDCKIKVLKKSHHLNSTLCFYISDAHNKNKEQQSYFIQSKIMYYLLFPIWATNYTFYSSNNVDFVRLLRVTSILFMISRSWLKYLE